MTIIDIVTDLAAHGHADIAAAVANFETVEDLAADVWTEEEEYQIGNACSRVRRNTRGSTMLGKDMSAAALAEWHRNND